MYHIKSKTISNVLMVLAHKEGFFYQVTYLINKHQSHVRNHQAVPSHGVLAKAGHYSVTTLERSKFTVL